MACENNPYSGEKSLESCTAFTYQSAAVSVPVTVRPKVSTGNINTFCCGEPSISPSPYKIICNSKAGNCSFILTQNICVEIPIEFSAEACTGYPYIECGEVTSKKCENCEDG